MYLLARRIKALGVKMVLSGEGADEAFGGYLYFHKAPSAAELHAECVRKVRRAGPRSPRDRSEAPEEPPQPRIFDLQTANPVSYGTVQNLVQCRTKFCTALV